MRTIGRKKGDDSPTPRYFSGSVGLGILATVLLLLGIPWWIVVPLAVAGFFGGILLLVPKKKSFDVSVEGMTPAMIERTLDEARKKIEAIGEAARSILNQDVRRKAEAVRSQASLVLEEITRDPRDIKAARQFLSYYLDATLKIVRQYAALSGRNRAKGPEIDALLAKAEGMRGTFERAFGKQRALLLENDAMNLEAELTVLDKTMKMQGLADDAEKGGLSNG